MSWRDFLCWGIVFAYFTMPVVFFALVFSGQQGWIKWDAKAFPQLRNFFDTVTALIFGLTGLNSLDKYTANKTSKPE